MDPLRSVALEIARATSPAEKLRQALEMMRAGFALKRASLRARFPEATELEVDAMLPRWMAYDDE